VVVTETFSGTETFTDVVPCRESLGAYDITQSNGGFFTPRCFKSTRRASSFRRTT
jgi:hypothetical protein